LFLASSALNRREFPTRPLGFELTRRELDVMQRRRDATVDRHAPAITGSAGTKQATDISDQLLSVARLWTWHVAESLLAFLAAVVVLELNQQFRLGLEPGRLVGLLPRPTPGHGLSAVLDFLSAQANVVYYAFLAPFLVWVLRSLQRRPALHRQGIRELLIGDTRYVHQIAWLLARRLFSLSYGFATIKPYSADSQDDLVLTHEPVRGTLALFGIPDGRRRHLAVRANAAAMTAKQFGNSRSVGGAGADVVTIGHGPVAALEGSEAHVALVSGQPESSSSTLDLLIEDLFDSWERLLAMQVLLNGLSARISRLGPFRYDRSRTKDQVFAPTTAAPVSASLVYELIRRSPSATMARLKRVVPRPRVDAVASAEWSTGGTLIGFAAPHPPEALFINRVA